MAQIINMPKEGITVESCLVGAWRKGVGDAVAVDDVLFDYETDKAAFECLSTTEGVLLHKFYEEGDEAPVLTPVAIVGEAGEDISALLAAGADAGDAWEAGNAGEAAQGPGEDGGAGAAGDESKGEGLLREDSGEGDEGYEGYEGGEGGEGGEGDGEEERLKISPRARSLAESQGIDLSHARPSGPGGRILEADVMAAADAAYAAHEEEPAPPEEEKARTPGLSEVMSYEKAAMDTRPEPVTPAGTDAVYSDEKFSKIRQVIGKTMMTSLQSGAQLTNHHSFDATSILNMREDFKNIDESYGYRGVSVGDVILYVTSRVLAKHPEINALIAEAGIRKYYTVNLGVAVDTPRGLVVPTIFGAEKKTLREISSEVKALAANALEGSISPDSLTGGTFTVSNLGATGVEVFTPIINPPQAAIAGINGIVERVRAGKDGRVEVYPSIGVSLTYDHRAIDGAPASRFAKELCEALADFSWKTIALDGENGIGGAK